jgi:hypothetical protein
MCAKDFTAIFNDGGQSTAWGDLACGSSLSFRGAEGAMSNPKIETSETPTNLKLTSDSEFDSREASYPSGKTANSSTRDPIKDFLNQKSSGDSKPRHCSACGETMQYLNAYFWLDGTDVASLVPLPFCPVCEPDLLTSLRRKSGLARIARAS